VLEPDACARPGDVHSIVGCATTRRQDGSSWSKLRQLLVKQWVCSFNGHLHNAGRRQDTRPRGLLSRNKQPSLIVPPAGAQSHASISLMLAALCNSAPRRAPLAAPLSAEKSATDCRKRQVPRNERSRVPSGRTSLRSAFSMMVVEEAAAGRKVRGPSRATVTCTIGVHAGTGLRRSGSCQHWRSSLRCRRKHHRFASCLAGLPFSAFARNWTRSAAQSTPGKNGKQGGLFHDMTGNITDHRF